MQATKQLYAGSSVAELYRSAFKAFPLREALVEEGNRLTYQELETRCHRMVRYFQSIGLRRQDGIGLLSGNRVDAVVAIIATQLLGLRYTALHPLGSAQDHAFILRDGGIKVLLVDAPRYAERGLALAGSGLLDHVLTLGPAAFGTDAVAASAAFDGSDMPLEVQADDVAKISYTGGTTGTPKGVVHLQRTTITMILQQLACWEWPEDPRFLVTTPISHASGAMILPTFLRGGTVFLTEKFSPEGFFTAVGAYGITCTFLVPSQIYSLLDSPALGDYAMPSLQRIWYGAAPIAQARLVEALQRFGRVFGQIYGQAEAPMTICYLRSDEHDLSRPQWMRSCGRPLPGNEVKLLDTQGNEVPTGEIGEVCVRGNLVMAGYLNRPEATSEAFAGDWLHTGDMARKDANGYLYLVDRAKDMIISGGFNVYSTEVENCLAQHPAIASSAVIGVPHEKWGEAVTAVVVLKPGAQASEDELIGFVKEHKGVVSAPKQVVIVEALPMTALGKVDKKTIRAQYWSGQDRHVA